MGPTATTIITAATGAALRLLARRGAWALAALVALAVVLAAPAAPARAEVIEFNPGQDEVPTVLEAEDLALLDQLNASGAAYLYSQPSPDGSAVLALVNGTAGFISLADGALTELQDPQLLLGRITSRTYTRRLTTPSWLDATTTTHVNQTQRQVDQNTISLSYERVTFDATTGEATTEPLTGLRDSRVLSASPDGQHFLALELPRDAAAAEVIDLAPGFDGLGPDDTRPGDLPDDLPGQIGLPPLGELELQQAEFTLALVDGDGEARRELMALPADSSVSIVSWAPDSSALALGTMTMPGWVQARPGRRPPGSGNPNLGSINVQEALGQLPPDENPLVTGTRLVAFGTDGQQRGELRNTDFPQGLLAGVTFAPSGARALLTLQTRSELQDRPHPTYAYGGGLEYHLLDAASFSVTEQVTAPGADTLATGAAFAADDTLLLITPAEVDTHIATYDLASGTATTVWDRSGSMRQLTVGGGHVVFGHETVDQPAELYAAPLGDVAGAGALTAVGGEALATSALATAEVTWTSDGETLHGLYVYHEDTPFPPEAPAPLVVWQEGGPGPQMRNSWGMSVEAPYSMLPHFGLPVLVANAAGRTVKSPDFFSAMADGTSFGQLDIAQIKDGVEHLVSEGIADPGRIGVTGCSYGGYFTLQSLRTYPDLYAAGNAQCSLTELTEEYTFGFTPYVSYLMGRTPFADPAEYLRDSPYFGAGDISAPTLLFHGTNDFLPISLIDNIHDQIESSDVPVTFLRVEGEGHGFGHPNSQRYAAQLQIDFFRRYLIEGVTPEPEPANEIYLPATYRAFDVAAADGG